jgi:hypothetical protein
MNPEKPIFEKQNSGLSKEILARIEAEFNTEPSAKRIAELNQELKTVLAFFDTIKIKTYIAGGTGLDLINGKWDRDHQDLDIAIMGDNKKKFYQAAIDAGFIITDPDRNPLDLETIIDNKTHNAFLYRATDDGITQFEIIFLNEQANGDIELTDKTLIPASLYDNAPVVNIDGQEVTLQPPAIILFHKLIDGRRKDFWDIRKIWDNLDETTKQELNLLLQKANKKFNIGENEFTDIQTLLEIAEQQNQSRQVKFLTEKANEYQKMLEAQLMTVCEEIHEIYKKCSTPGELIQVLIEKYNGFIPERKKIMEAMITQLYSEPTITLDQFKNWAKQKVDITDNLREKIVYEYIPEKLWTTNE